MNSIIATYLRAHPDKARPAAELQELEQSNKITNDNFTVGKKNTPKKPQRTFESDGSASSGGEETKAPAAQQKFWTGPAVCRQCKASKDGYRCVQKQEHVACANCNIQIPRRPDLQQQCRVCERFFCNLSFRTLKHCDVGVQTLAQTMIKWTTLPPNSLSENLFEQNVLKDLLRQQGKTVQQVCAQTLEQPQDVVLAGRAVRPQRDWYVCKICSDLLFGELIYRYREQAQVPPNVKGRPKCWYGRECTTQKHNQSHAAKYDHICGNTKRK